VSKFVSSPWVISDIWYRTLNDRFAGNGGLSLRRISMVKKILEFQERFNDTQPEDEWFGKRILVYPGSTVASGEQEKSFSVEDVWHEKPMGFHVRDGGMQLAEDVWKSPERRKANFDYCPELVMIMPMKLERERCDGDNKEGEIVTEGDRMRLEEERKKEEAASRNERTGNQKHP
jgi:hypothetical protein